MLPAALRQRLEGLREALEGDEPPAIKALHVAERATVSLRLRPYVHVTRRVIVELRSPPPLFRGLRDLLVRRARPEDLEPLARIDDTDRSLIGRRFLAGDLAYVGQCGGDLLCHIWFHRGPAPFEEDRLACVSWALAPSTFWSYNGAARKDARSSGIFVKMFQSALRELFFEHGAERVQCFIADHNKSSLAMHRGLGFAVVGTLATVALPAVKWLRWDGAGVTRRWWLPRSSRWALPLPPP